MNATVKIKAFLFNKFVSKIRLNACQKLKILSILTILLLIPFIECKPRRPPRRGSIFFLNILYF